VGTPGDFMVDAWKGFLSTGSRAWYSLKKKPVYERVKTPAYSATDSMVERFIKLTRFSTLQSYTPVITELLTGGWI
jgi:hypothetical protein